MNFVDNVNKIHLIAMTVASEEKLLKKRLFTPDPTSDCFYIRLLLKYTYDHLQLKKNKQKQ